MFGDIDNKSISNDKVSNTIPIADLSRNKYQPRTIFDEEKLNELSKSINENGVIQPIAVRPNKYEKGKYEIVAGERRWRAAEIAKIHDVPVLIKELTDEEVVKVSII